jgi:hypothetical protein
LRWDDGRTIRRTPPIPATFRFVLPTLLVLPWLLHLGTGFWPALGLAAALTMVLYFLMMRVLAVLGVDL